MRIDIASPQGNTLFALGIATRLLKEAGATKERIDSLTREVFDARSAVEAREHITKATNGSITFYNSQQKG